jgi:hypothetical protein
MIFITYIIASLLFRPQLKLIYFFSLFDHDILCWQKDADLWGLPVLDAYIYSRLGIVVDQLMEYPGTWKIYVQTRQTPCCACFPGVPTSSPLAGLRRHRSDQRERLYNLTTLSSYAAYSTKLLLCLCSLFSGRFL